MLGLRRLAAGELEERRGGDETSIAVREAAPLRPEVEHGTAARRGGRKSEAHRRKFDVVPGGSHDGREVGDADVVGLRQVRFALAGRNAPFQQLHHLAVSLPGDMLLEVVAHAARMPLFGFPAAGRLGCLRRLWIPGLGRGGQRWRPELAAGQVKRSLRYRQSCFEFGQAFYGRMICGYASDQILEKDL